MKNVGHDLLLPLLRVLSPMLQLRAELSIEDLPRPSDSPSVIASGSDPDRVLLIGSGPVMGYGVLSHELDLAGHLARQVSAFTGRGVTVDIVPVGDMTMQSTISQFKPINLARYDAIVLAVGVNDVLRITPRSRWRREVTTLANYLSDAMPANAQSFLVGIQPMRSIKTFANAAGGVLEIHRRSLNREAALICADFPLVNFVPFNPRTEIFDRYRSRHTYARWATIILPPIATALQAAPRVEAVASPEEARLQALYELRILDTAPEERFDRISQFAKKLFATEAAVISFLDRDREWAKSRAGLGSTGAPGGMMLGRDVIKKSGVLIIEDASIDPNYSSRDVVAGPPYLRFYAGHPIESHNGERVGVISVFDRQPRRFTEVDTRLLRDLAFLVQRELAIVES